MPELPDRPDLGQLRRQARELQRAATAHDEDALRKVHSVSTTITLAAAQLAVARDFGFASWPRMKAEVERRRATVNDSERESPDAAIAPILAAWRNLPAEQQALVAKQYADRPGLRPILDAVLAAAAALGPATVEARVTVVSLVSPRRTFASIKATTKTRVDLGLRLENVTPEGRLQAARDLGSGTINVRIALAGPGEVDEEVTGWLRRAYAESVTPAPRRPARRPAPPVGTLTVVIEGTELPGLSCAPAGSGRGYRNVHVALGGRDPGRVALAIPGRPGSAIEPVPGDAPSARWEATVTVRRDGDGFDFTGPYVGGDRTDRSIGLAWGEVPGDGTLRLFRGAKLRLADVPPALVQEALAPGRRLVARVRLTDSNGNPICARLHPPYIQWHTE